MATVYRDLIEWKPDYSVDIPSIDSQHQTLVSIIRHLQEAMLAGKTRKIIAPLFTAMNRYTEFHFEYEEKLMEENVYLGLESHRDTHAALIAQLKELETKYLQGNLHAGAPLMHFLRNWLFDHICVHDKEYSAPLKEKGAS